MLRGRLLIAMALLQSSGAISFSDIKGMYGGSTNVSIGDYIKSGSFVPTAPSSGNIPATKADMSLSKFYSTAKEYVITLAATTTNYNWQTAFATAYPAPTRSTDYIARLIVNSGVTVGATATSSYALTVGAFPSAARLYIDNYGSIQGAGGAGASLADGDGLSGGPAVNADVAQTTTITLKSGGSIYGGGGGGGKGGTGGSGGKGGDYSSYIEQYDQTTLSRWDLFCSPGSVWIFNLSLYWNGSYIRNAAQQYYTTISTASPPPAQSSSPYYNITEITVDGIKYTRGSLALSLPYLRPPNGNQDPYDAYRIRKWSTTVGGTGGTGGAGGNGGRGAGYNQTVANGDDGSTGSAGNAGGTNAGTGGTGGTGGSGGNGGGLGSVGFSGNTGNQGGTGGGGGAAGASGASGTTAGSAGRSVFKNGRSTVTVTVESGGAILPSAA